MSQAVAREVIEAHARYTAPEVARIVFGMSLRWFAKNRHRLEAVENFPKPISELARPHRWLGEALITWERRKPTEQDGAPGAGDNVVQLRRKLHANATRVAHGKR